MITIGNAESISRDFQSESDEIATVRAYYDSGMSYSATAIIQTRMPSDLRKVSKLRRDTCPSGHTEISERYENAYNAVTP